MTYAITSRKIEIDESIQIEAGVPICIKVPGKDLDDQPYVGFASKELGEKFLNLKNLSNKDYFVVSVKDGLRSEYHNQPILLFENEQQLLAMEKDSEGYDYESQIHESAL